MRICIKIMTMVLNCIYFMMKLFPEKNKVVMISRQANEPSIDFLLLKEALLKQDSNIEVIFLCHTLDGGIKSSLISKVKYAFHMLRQMWEIATSKIVVLDTYCIVASLLHHRPTIKIIQMWHSIGTMKKFGYTALGTKEGTRKNIAEMMGMHKQYSYVLASSPAYQTDLAKGFSCDEAIVKIMPLPRIDLLRDENFRAKKKKEIFERYPELKDKKIILYAPTFRKNEDQMQKAVGLLSNALMENQVLILKLHPLSKIKIDNKNIVFAPDFSSFDMMFIADAMISDYSCIIYEAAILDIPLYFYNFDFEKYSGNRGLAIDYNRELPGVISQNPKDLIQAISSQPYDMKKLKQFCDKYVVCKGSASDQIAKFIVSLMV